MADAPETPRHEGEPDRVSSHGLPSPKRKVGHYQIVRQIGRGGMATVYLARQATLERDVALKELSSFHAASPEFAERFLRESRLAGSLNHPNIVTVHEYFEEGGTPYIAMEYVPRGSLRPYVGRLGLAQFAGVMEGVLAGLAHAETLGIVHRDLKPENLMVTSDGRVKITDFGIAKATQTAGTGAFLTATGTTVGTPTYMAPEQAMAAEVGAWTDLYSVGIMAYEHVVGRAPFHDTDAPMVILMRHLNERIAPAVEVNPEVDPDLSEWIDRLLIKDARERTQNAISAWEELEEIVLGLLGPRWRREARLPEHVTALDTPRALTPAPFDTGRASTPAPMAAGAPDQATPTPEPIASPPAPEPVERQPPAPAPVGTEPSAGDAVEAEAVYMTFGRADLAPTPDRPGGPSQGRDEGPSDVHVSAPPTPTAGSEAGALSPDAEVSAPDPHMSAPAPAADAGARGAAVPAEETGYLTFGPAPAPGTPPVPLSAEPPGAVVEPPGAVVEPPGAVVEPPGAVVEPPAAVVEPIAPPATPESSAAQAPAAPTDAAEAAATPVAEAVRPSETLAPGAVAAFRPEEPIESPEAPVSISPPTEGRIAAASIPSAPVARPSEVPPEVDVPHEPTGEPIDEHPSRPAARPRPSTARRAIIVALVGAVLAAALGFLVAPSKSSSSPAHPSLVGSASAGPLTISFPGGWRHQATSAVSDLTVDNELELVAARPASGTLVMGTASSVGSTLLPAGFVSALPSLPTPQVVTLGASQFYRYLDLMPKGATRPETVYALPTTAGAVIAVCQPTGTSVTFMTACERVVGTLRLSSGKVLGLGPNAAYASAVSSVTGRLNAEANSAQARLASARTPREQAKAAAQLAAASKTAASQVQKLNPGPAAVSANAAIAAALRTISDGYASLELAAMHNDRGAYQTARSEIQRASDALSAAFGQLSRSGYTIS
jgi:Protein kinase domain